MEWGTVNDVVNDLGLESDPNDLQGVIRELKERRNDAHPDKTRDKSTDEFQRLVRALEFVDVQSKALVPLTAVTALVKQVTDAVTQRESTDAHAARAVAARTETFHRLIRPRRFTLAAVGTAFSVVFLFPQQFETHPYIERFLYQPVGVMTWVALLAVLGLLWIRTALEEARHRDVLETLYSRRFQERVLKRFGSAVFSRTHVQEHMARWTRENRKPMNPWGSLRLLRVLAIVINRLGARSRIGADAIEEAADLALRRYLDAAIVRRVPVPDGQSPFTEWYRVAAE